MILGGLFDVCVSSHTTHKLLRKMFRMLQVINHWWKGAHFAQKWMKHCQDWGKDGQPKGRLGNTFLSSRSSSLTCIQKNWKGKWLLKYFLLLFLLFIVPLLFRGKPCMFISSFFNPSFWNKLRMMEAYRHICFILWVREQKGNVYSGILLEIVIFYFQTAMLRVMSPFVINVPTRDLLVPYAKWSFQILVGDYNCNVCKHVLCDVSFFVAIDHSHNSGLLAQETITAVQDGFLLNSILFIK